MASKYVDYPSSDSDWEDLEDCNAIEEEIPPVIPEPVIPPWERQKTQVRPDPTEEEAEKMREIFRKNDLMCKKFNELLDFCEKNENDPQMRDIIRNISFDTKTLRALVEADEQAEREAQVEAASQQNFHQDVHFFSHPPASSWSEVVGHQSFSEGHGSHPPASSWTEVHPDHQSFSEGHGSHPPASSWSEVVGHQSFSEGHGCHPPASSWTEFHPAHQSVTEGHGCWFPPPPPGYRGWNPSSPFSSYSTWCPPQYEPFPGANVGGDGDQYAENFNPRGSYSCQQSPQYNGHGGNGGFPTTTYGSKAWGQFIPGQQQQPVPVQQPQEQKPPPPPKPQGGKTKQYCNSNYRQKKRENYNNNRNSTSAVAPSPSPSAHSTYQPKSQPKSHSTYQPKSQPTYQPKSQSTYQPKSQSTYQPKSQPQRQSSSYQLPSQGSVTQTQSLAGLSSHQGHLQPQKSQQQPNVQQRGHFTRKQGPPSKQ